MPSGWVTSNEEGVTLAPVMAEFLRDELWLWFRTEKGNGDEDTLFDLFKMRNCFEALGGDTRAMDSALLARAGTDREFAVKVGDDTPEYLRRIDHVVAVISGKEK